MSLGSHTTGLTNRLSRVSQPSFDSVELFHVSHPRWPFPPTTSSTPPPKKIHIACFDSSFNPPTRAHFAISMTSYPSPYHSTAPSINDDPYTARLLLLSARNVDKSLKPGDATLEQRIEMMVLQANDMVEKGESNVAVGALNHPTFVGKSEIILRWLHEIRLPSLLNTHDGSSLPEIKLTFLIGSDTLTRLFEPKYYIATPSLSSTSHTTSTPEENMHAELNILFNTNACSIVSAHRSTSLASRRAEEEFIELSSECLDRLKRGDIRFLDVGKEEMDMSSTIVRRLVKKGEGVERLCGERIAGYVLAKGLYKD